MSLIGASWRTTCFGILSVLAAAMTFIILPMLDSDCNTHADFGGFVVAVCTALGLANARDNKVTSEQAGVK